MLVHSLSGEAGILVQYSGNLIDAATILDKNLAQPPTDRYIYFTAGVATLLVGKKLTGATSAATAQLKAIVITSGALADGDAAGILFLSGISGTFSSGENLQIGGATKAVAGSAVLSCPLNAPATSALVAIETNAIKYASSGMTPTTTIGIPGPAGSFVRLDGWSTVKNFAFLNASSSANSVVTIQVNY